MFVMIMGTLLFAETYRIRVHKADTGLSLETFTDKKITDKKITIVSTDDAIAVFESAAALTFSNVTDSIEVLEATESITLDNVTNLLTIISVLDGMTVTNLAGITNYIVTSGGS